MAIIRGNMIYIFRFILLFTSSSPCRKDQFPVSYFWTSLIVLNQVYNQEIPHHLLFFCCGLVDILYRPIPYIREYPTPYTPRAGEEKAQRHHHYFSLYQTLRQQKRCENEVKGKQNACTAGTGYHSMAGLSCPRQGTFNYVQN